MISSLDQHVVIRRLSNLRAGKLLYKSVLVVPSSIPIRFPLPIFGLQRSAHMTGRGRKLHVVLSAAAETRDLAHGAVRHLLI